METFGIALGSIWTTWDGVPSSRLLNHIFRHREHNITHSTTTHNNTFSGHWDAEVSFSGQRLPSPITAFPPKHALTRFSILPLLSRVPSQPDFFPLLFSLVVPSLGLCNEWSSQWKLLETLLIRVSQLFSLQFRLESQLDTSWFKKSNKGQSSATGKALSPCALLIFFFFLNDLG